MDNRAVAAVFGEMADLLEIEGGDTHRVRAFRRIGRVIEGLAEPLGELLKYQRLQRISGIGEGGVRRVKEILARGSCADLDALRTRVPTGVRELTRVEGVGPKLALELHRRLGVRSLDELMWTTAQGGLQGRVPGLGAAAERRIVRGLETALRLRSLKPLRLDEAEAWGQQLIANLASLPSVLRAMLAGSVRRGKERVEDLDVLVVAHETRHVVARFIGAAQASEVMAQGTGRAQVRLGSGHQVDLRVIAPEHFGAALHYFTGSKAHNIAIRMRATRMGLRLGDRGVYRRDGDRLVVAGGDEPEIFATVGLPYIAPELRENTGEIEAAAAGRLPQLLTEAQLRGDLHVHARRSDGSATIAEMAAAAAALGMEYLAVTDDARALGRDLARRAGRRRPWISSGVALLVGIEVSILSDGTLDAAPELLRQCDFVVARMGTPAPTTATEYFARIERALATGVIDCLAHPTGRLIGEPPPLSIDIERLLRVAQRTQIALELNADPRRLDLDAAACRRAKDLGVLVAINSGARTPLALSWRRFGVATARRGWLAAGEVLNTRSRDELAVWRDERLRRQQTVVSSLAAHHQGGRAQTSAPAETAPETVALANELLTVPLSAALRERLDRYLRGGKDDALDAALTTLDANPLQRAFALLVKRTDPQ